VAAPASPCTGICQLNFSGVCKGCGRSLGEIAEWTTASDTRKREIRAAARKRRHDQRRRK
jgi:predicted Fe-S protein YdhL (DUF1289 family)